MNCPKCGCPMTGRDDKHRIAWCEGHDCSFESNVPMGSPENWQLMADLGAELAKVNDERDKWRNKCIVAEAKLEEWMKCAEELFDVATTATTHWDDCDCDHCEQIKQAISTFNKLKGHKS